MPQSLLIVDDSESMRKILMRMVRISGIFFDRISEAGDGQEALDILTADPVDVILCDVHMPRMDGCEFVQKVRENSDYDHINILVVSSESSDKYVGQMLEHGANDYIRKPFDSQNFQAKLLPLVV